jgi:hypothetical protein
VTEAGPGAGAGFGLVTVEDQAIPTRSHTRSKQRQKEIARMVTQKQNAARREMETGEIVSPADEKTGAAE